MTNKQKGIIAEIAVTRKLVEHGHVVSKPISVERYDLIVDTGHSLHRGQVKTANYKNRYLEFNCYSQSRNVSKPYSKKDIDCFLVYCRELDTTYLVPVEKAGKGKMVLRLESPKNNQTKKVNLATDFQI